MVPRTFPSTYETANGETRMVVFFLSSVSGLTKWVDYIPVKFTMLETQDSNSYNNDGVVLVDPLSSTTNKQAWIDYIPVFVDANDTVAWRVDASGFIPVGFAVKPTLNLDFAGTKTLDPRITFTRASSATYFDANGILQTAASGVARFDHNPTTGESLGLLVEEQRTNLFEQSQEFDNAYWTKTTATITANTIVAPDGTLTGDKLILNNTETAGYVSRVSSYTSGTAYTFSCYAKQGEQTDFRVLAPAAAFGSTLNGIFDLSTGTVTSFTASSASIQSVGNGWYRCSITATATSTTTGTNQFRSSYTGNGFDGIFIWGAQLEAGASPTSYIPTVAATVTRNADAASMTGTNFSSWYRADEGTLYGEASTYDVSLGRLSFSVTDGSTANRIHVGNGASPKGFIANGGVTQLNISIPSVVYTNNTFSKTILAYANNNGNTAANGTIGVDDTSLSVPMVTQANIGNLTPTNSLLNGHIRRIAYYPSRLSGAQLQALTR